MYSTKKSNIKNILLPALFLAFFVFVNILTCSATGADNALKGLGDAAVKAYTGQPAPANTSADTNNTTLVDAGVMTSLPGAIGKIVGVALSLIGVVFLVLMIYAGFTWMFARGNEQDVTKAKDLLQTAIVGLVIVLAAYAITAFVGAQLIG